MVAVVVVGGALQRVGGSRTWSVARMLAGDLGEARHTGKKQKVHAN